MKITTMSKKHLVIIMVIISLLSCDPQRVVLLNNDRQYDKLTCTDKQFKLFFKKGLSSSDNVFITLSKNDTFLLHGFVLNSKEIEINVHRESYGVIINRNNLRFIQGDTIKLFFSYNQCEFIKEYVLGKTIAVTD